MRRACAALAVTAAAGAACTGAESTLGTAGPPMIRQVRLTERYVDSAMMSRVRTVFAFGTHPLAEPSEVHAVSAALAVANSLRVVVDELLVGNHLEEIACRGEVDADEAGGALFGRVPEGAKPDDVARCAVEDDELASACPGSDRHSVCICRKADGCLRNTGERVPAGMPVGVLDADRDGAADSLRLIPGAAGILCGALPSEISVAINPAASHWYPSGDQALPPLSGFEALGPAIVVVPGAALPTGSRCRLRFGDEVVDKQGERVCAPPAGDVAAGCEPGDVSAFEFGVEPLAIAPEVPDGMTGVSRTAVLAFEVTAPVAAATLGGIQIAPAPPGAGAPVITTSGTTIRIDFSGAQLAAQTTYTVTFPGSITDAYGQPLPEAKIYRFTTGN